MNVLHDMFPNFYDLSKEGNENPEILGDKNASVLSHTKFHQGCSVVSVRMWGVCLLDLSHSLQNDCMERLWWDRVFYLLWFSVQTFFHFNAVFWLYGNRIISLQTEALNRLLCDCATGMICVVGVPNFSLFSE